MGKTNYSVARVVTYTKQSIGKAERHNERKNTNYTNMNVDLEQTKNFDAFLLISFLIVSSCLMNAKKSINQINPLLSEDSLDKIDKFLEIYRLKNCEDLVQYFNLNFFNRVKLTFYEYNLNLTKANGFGWIFSPSGIRQKLEENKFLD